MTVTEYLEQTLKDRGTTKTWLADKLGITKQDLNYRLKNNSLSAEELLQVARILDIDLNSLK